MDRVHDAHDVSIRELSPVEFARLEEIDRTEEIRVGYRVALGELERMDVDWDTPNWFSTGEEHSVSALVDSLHELHGVGATTLGAFDGDRLVGIVTWRPKLTGTMAQLAFLHVSAGYRRRGIASRLFERVEALARKNGAVRFYVSATPSESAVGFYTSQGFALTHTPHPELLALEPEDIHMTKELTV